MSAWQKLPCSCLVSVDADGFMWIEAEGFICEARHKQGDLVEVREGFARVTQAKTSRPPENPSNVTRY